MKSGLFAITLVLCVNAGALAFSSSLHSRSVCLLPMDQGPCRLYIPRYYFDQASGQCKQFIYGGCQGNENSFPTLKECQKTCSQLDAMDPLCYLPKRVGPCRARMPRYFFNITTWKCELFYYGGCLGNQNNFWPRKKCSNKCVCKYI